jgi:hypothetical protein
MNEQSKQQTKPLCMLCMHASTPPCCSGGGSIGQVFGPEILEAPFDHPNLAGQYHPLGLYYKCHVSTKQQTNTKQQATTQHKINKHPQ